MTPAEIHKRAQLNRDCGLAADAAMIDALADVYEAAENVLRIENGAPVERQLALVEVLSSRLIRVEALKP